MKGGYLGDSTHPFLLLAEVALIFGEAEQLRKMVLAPVGLSGHAQLLHLRRQRL